MLKRGKILVCCEHYPATSETFIVEHVLGLHRAGWQVRVACLTWNEPAWNEVCAERIPGVDHGSFLGIEFRPELDDLKEAGLKRHIFLAKQLGWLYSRRTRGLMRREKIRAGLLRRFVREWQPDLVHAHFGPNAVQAAVAVRGLGIPLIAEFHGHDVTSYPLKRGWGIYREHLRGSRAIVHSSFVKRQVSEGAGLEGERITYGIDTSRFRPPQRAEHWPQPIRLLHVGRLIYQKGQEVAIRALARLPEFDLRLTLVGDGDARREMEALCDELGVQNRVEFLGAVPHAEVATLMGTHDIVLVPSRRSPTGWEEAFCLVAAEGMTMGMGVIGTATGGLGDTVGDGGIVVAPDDVPALANGIKQMIETGGPRQWQQIATASAKRFNHALMHAEYDRIAQEVAATYGD